ncbi:hypothetical protein Hanom_Chr06g00559871 [Helianthus anomalus]
MSSKSSKKFPLFNESFDSSCPRNANPPFNNLFPSKVEALSLSRYSRFSLGVLLSHCVCTA